MRRALPVLLATIVALVLLLSFRTSPEAATVTSPKVGASSSTSTTVPSAGAGAAPPTTAATGSHTYTGVESDNRYGPVQVEIKVDGTRLTEVTALQMPSDREHSARLSAEAAPILRSEALQAQSARIDIVSGATFTSESYAQSLQSALDQAHLGG